MRLTCRSIVALLIAQNVNHPTQQFASGLFCSFFSSKKSGNKENTKQNIDSRIGTWVLLRH
jgi:hypothetical protein